jgi:hypothetical protein
MFLLAPQRCTENKNQLTLDSSYIQQARIEAINIQLADNWAERLHNLHTHSVEFQMLVFHFWELDVFGETSFTPSVD